jgi:DNA-binding MarR family transcriptional regulator
MKAHRNYAESALTQLGVHVAQEMILFHLWEEDGITQSQSAKYLCVEPPTATKMVQRMEASGLVKRRHDPEDAPASRAYLSEQGRFLEKVVLEAWWDLEERTLVGRTDAE